METDTQRFGQLFTKFRLKAEYLTLSEFGKALADEGLLYEDSIFSRWQKGNRVPRDRRVLLTIIKVFIKRKGITTPAEANMLLEAAIHGYLTTSEETELFGTPKTTGAIMLTGPYISALPSVNPTKDDEFNTNLSTIITSSHKLENIEKQADLLFDIIYEGYPSIASERLRKLSELIKVLQLDTTQQGKNILSKIGWLYLRSLSDMYGLPKEYMQAILQTEEMITYAKEQSTTNLGELHFMHSSLDRKKTLIQTKSEVSKSNMLEDLTETQYAATLIPNTALREKLITILEIPHFALALRDKKLFDRAIYDAMTIAEELPPELKYLKGLIWDIKARGNIRFGFNIDAALDNIKIAKGYTNPRYQIVNLNIQSTELQALELSNDPEYQRYADTLRDLLRMETAVLGNPYQRMRFEKKKFLGL